MRSNDKAFPFGLNYNFSTDNLLTVKNEFGSANFPPVSGDMIYADGTRMFYADGTEMVYA